MTDFRALCAELHAAFNTYAVDEAHHDLLVRARAALAQPEPQSLKQQGLDALRALPCQSGALEAQSRNTIRLALEALPDD